MCSRPAIARGLRMECGEWGWRVEGGGGWRVKGGGWRVGGLGLKI